ncbi:MAG TPA: MqnA/MqnD/SBP family protein [Stellaceae bacterium]|jgi:NitT/TauT family transport system substrate-binding protein|nr:MqnA/MqnD/SBP family protein [Stellaceae bacterium]
MKKQLRTATLASAFAALIAGPAVAKDTISFAYLLDPAYDAVVWPLTHGKVNSDTVEVNVKSLDIPALLQATGAKTYDVVMTAAIGVPQAKSRGLELAIMATALRNQEHGKGAGIYVRADSPYKSMPDLKGKTLATQSMPSTGTTLMRIGLWKTYNMNVAFDGGDLRWVEVPATAMPGALLTGRIDAASLTHSEAYNAQHSKDFRILANLDDAINKAIGEPAVVAILAGYPEKLAAKPAAYKEFARMVKASADYTRAHIDEVAGALSKETKMDPAFFSDWLNEYTQVPMVVSNDDVKAIQRLWELSKELNIIKEYPPAESMIWKDAIRQ